MATTDINHGGLRIKTEFTLFGIIIIIIGWCFLFTLFIVGTSVNIVLGLNMFGLNGAFLLNLNILVFRLILIKVIGLQKILQLLEGIDLNKKLYTQELPGVHFARVIIFSFIMQDKLSFGDINDQQYGFICFFQQFTIRMQGGRLGKCWLNIMQAFIVYFFDLYVQLKRPPIQMNLRGWLFQTMLIAFY